MDISNRLVHVLADPLSQHFNRGLMIGSRPTATADNLGTKYWRLFDRLPTNVRTPPTPAAVRPTISLAAPKANSGPKTSLDSPPIEERPATIRPSTRPEQMQQAHRAILLERFETVRDPHARG